MIDWSIRLGDLFMFGSALIAFVAAYVRLGTSIAKATERAQEARETAGMVSAKLDLVSTNLNQFKVEAAEKYTSRHTLEALETRLIASVDKLTDRVDELLQRRP